MLLAMADFFTTYWPVLLAGSVLLILGAYLLFRNEDGKFRRDRLLLRVPAVNDVLRCAAIERFCRIPPEDLEGGSGTAGPRRGDAKGEGEYAYRRD